MKPIAGINQYPFVVGGLKVSAAKINGQTYVDELYIHQQRAYNVYDLIDSDDNVFEFVNMVYRDSNNDILQYSTDNADIATSLVDGTFCIKEEDAKEGIYGFSTLYQTYKIKIHDGHYIFRRNNEESEETFYIEPGDGWSVHLNQPSKTFNVVFSKGQTEDGDWKWDDTVFDLISKTNDELVLKPKMEINSTPITYTFGTDTSTSTGKIDSPDDKVKSIHIVPDTYRTTMQEDFNIHVEYDPTYYVGVKTGKWTYDTDIFQLVSSTDTEDTITLKPIFVDPFGNISNISFVSDADGNPSDEAEFSVVYAPLNKVWIEPAHIVADAGETVTATVKFDPDNANHDGSWGYYRKDPITDIVISGDTITFKSSDVGRNELIFIPLEGNKTAGKYTLSPATSDMTFYFPPINSISITPNPVTLELGDKQIFTAQYDPADYPDNLKSAAWTVVPGAPLVISSDPDHPARADGLLYTVATGPGTAVLTHYAPDYPDFTRHPLPPPATSDITVNYSVLTGITLDPNPIAAVVNDTVTVTATYVPDTAEHNGVWKFKSDPDPDSEVIHILEQDADHIRFIPLQPSTDNILTITSGTISTDDPMNISYPELDNVELDPTSLALDENQQGTITVKYTPSDYAFKGGEWTFDPDDSLIDHSTDDDGNLTVTAKKLPTSNAVTIVATFDTYSTAFTGTPPSANIVISEETYTLTLDPTSQTTILTETGNIDVVYPADFEHKGGTWSFDPAGIIDETLNVVDPDTGNLTYTTKAVGTTTATFTNTFDGKTATSDITVEYAELTNVTFDPASGSEPAGTVGRADITYVPDNAEHGGTWVFDHPDVADVDTSYSTDDILKYNTFKAGSSTGTFTPKAAYTGAALTYPVTVVDSVLVGIAFDPPGPFTVTGTEEITINVVYDPDTAEHSGNWTFGDDQYINNWTDLDNPDSITFDGYAPGSTTITFTPDEDPTKAITQDLTIAYPALKSVALDPVHLDNAEINTVYFVDITYTTDDGSDYPDNFKGGTISHNTDPSIADITVLSTGDRIEVDTLKVGPTNYEFDSYAGPVTFGDVTVINSTLNDVTLTPDNSDPVRVGEDGSVTIEYDPADYSFKGGTWTFDPDDILTMDESTSTDDVMNYTGAKVGTTTATYTVTHTVDNPPLVAPTIDIEITYPVLNGVSVPSTSAGTEGSDSVINVTYDPAAYAYKGGTWAFADTTIADQKSVDADGNLTYTAKKVGSTDATFTATADSTKTATSTITVSVQELNSIQLNPDMTKVVADDTHTITVEYDPVAFLHKGGVWTFDPTDAVYDTKTDADGNLTYKADRAKAGSFYATFTPTADATKAKTAGPISVDYPPLTSIKLSPATQSVDVAKSGTITVAYTPSDYKYQTGHWTSDNDTAWSSTDKNAKVLNFTALIPDVVVTFHYVPDAKPSLQTEQSTVTMNYPPYDDITVSPDFSQIGIGQGSTSTENFIWTPNDYPMSCRHGTLVDNGGGAIIISYPDPDNSTAQFFGNGITTDATFTFTPDAGKSTAGKDSFTYHYWVGFDSDSVDFDPPSPNTVPLNSTNTIILTYNTTENGGVYPDELKGGTWNYGNGSIIDNDAISEAADGSLTFTAIAEGSDTLTFTPYHCEVESYTYDITVTNPVLNSITLDPLYELPYPGDEFDINITYDPPDSAVLGTWDIYLAGTTTDGTEYVELISNDINTATFRALKINKIISIDLVYTCAGVGENGTDVSTKNGCTIEFDKLNSVTLSPTSETKNSGDTFTIDITYDPDTAKHGGTWDLDHRYFNQTNLGEPGSEDQAIFQIVDYTADVQTLTFNSEAVPVIKSATNECTILPVALQQVVLSPNPITDLKPQDVFTIDIEYLPLGSQKVQGTWDYDSDYFTLDTIKSTIDQGVFTALKSTDPGDKTITYNTDVGEADNLSDSVSCTVDYSDLISLDIAQKHQIVPPDAYYMAKVGVPFDLDIIYNPDTAKHDAVWTKYPSPQYVTFNNKSDPDTVDVGNFTYPSYIQDQDHSDLEYIITSGGKQSSMFVYVRYDDLESIHMTSSPNVTLSLTGAPTYITWTTTPQNANPLINLSFQGYGEYVTSTRNDPNTDHAQSGFPLYALNNTPPDGITIQGQAPINDDNNTLIESDNVITLHVNGLVTPTALDTRVNSYQGHENAKDLTVSDGDIFTLINNFTPQGTSIISGSWNAYDTDIFELAQPPTADVCNQMQVMVNADTPGVYPFTYTSEVDPSITSTVNITIVSSSTENIVTDINSNESSTDSSSENPTFLNKMKSFFTNLRS